MRQVVNANLRTNVIAYARIQNMVAGIVTRILHLHSKPAQGRDTSQSPWYTAFGTMCSGLERLTGGPEPMLMPIPVSSFSPGSHHR